MRSRVLIVTGAIIVILLSWVSSASAHPIPQSLVESSQDRSAAQPTSGARLFEANCRRVQDSYDIGPGATGDNVREVQCLLNHTLSWDVYPHVIMGNGQYGDITTGAVRVFQQCVNNLGTPISVDGRVGPQTLPHLRWWGHRGWETGKRIC
jgi:hypothetical protein